MMALRKRKTEVSMSIKPCKIAKGTKQLKLKAILLDNQSNKLAESNVALYPVQPKGTAKITSDVDTWWLSALLVPADGSEQIVSEGVPIEIERIHIAPKGYAPLIPVRKG
jgi:hypothetical protein